MGSGVVASRLFFFQAEDGIRDYKVTGVQTCALPICPGELVPPAVLEKTEVFRTAQVAPDQALSRSRRRDWRHVPPLVASGELLDERGREFRDVEADPGARRSIAQPRAPGQLEHGRGVRPVKRVARRPLRAGTWQLISRFRTDCRCQLSLLQLRPLSCAFLHGLDQASRRFTLSFFHETFAPMDTASTRQ